MTSSRVSYPAQWTYTRHTKANPCPICGKPDWCSTRSDGAVHCMRIISPFADVGSAGFWHYPGGDPRNLGLTGYPNAQIGLANHSITEDQRPTKASPEDLDRVYTALLAACPLSDAHRASLLAAGFSRDDLSEYGTLGQSPHRVATILANSFSRELLQTIPGLFYAPEDRLAIAAPAGMLVAIRNVDGRIIAMQVRVGSPDGSKRYLWLSSTKHHGAGSGSPAHVITELGDPVVYITEGAKKAHRIAVHTGVNAIGLPGHAVQQDGLEALRELTKRGVLCAVIALDEDSDPSTVQLVDASRKKLVTECLALGLAVRVARWDASDAKGLDDLYQLRKQPRLEIVVSQSDMDDPGRRKPDRRLSTIEEAARYRQIRRVLWNEGDGTAKGSMTPAEKLGLLLSYEMTDLYPGTIAAGGCLTPVDLNLGALGRRVGISAALAGRTIKHLADVGLVDRTERYMEDTGHKRVAVAPARPLGYNEVLPEPDRRAIDRSRQRCKHCGADGILTRRICPTCGSVEDVLPPQAASDPIDQGKVVATAMAETIPVENTISNKMGPMYDSSVGVILQETSPTTDLSIDPLYESSVGPLQSETDMAMATIPSRSIDQQQAKHPGLCAPTPLPPVRPEPCSANRPYWGCFQCGKIMYRIDGDEGWWCGHCGQLAGPEPLGSLLVGQAHTRPLPPPRFGSA